MSGIDSTAQWILDARLTADTLDSQAVTEVYDTYMLWARLNDHRIHTYSEWLYELSQLIPTLTIECAHDANGTAWSYFAMVGDD